MKIICPLFLGVLLFSCRESNSGNNKKPGSADSAGLAVTATVAPQGSADWVENFREFRNAVYQHDRNKVKSFIDFPIMNENNEIWYLVTDGDESQLNRLGDTVKPFTEQHFDKYFDKLFTRQFINAALKIKSDSLNKKGEFETVAFKDKEGTYKIYATYDKAENTLSLNVASNITKGSDGEEVEDGEFSVVYMFNILNNGHLKFIQVRLAG